MGGYLTHATLIDVDISSVTTHVLSATDTAPIDHLIYLHSFEISGKSFAPSFPLPRGGAGINGVGEWYPAPEGVPMFKSRNKKRATFF